MKVSGFVYFWGFYLFAVSPSQIFQAKYQVRPSKYHLFTVMLPLFLKHLEK